jgi:hypothetical protein
VIFSPAQKIAIAREHLIDGVPVSPLVDQHKIHAVQFCLWQIQRFIERAVAFELKPNGLNVNAKTTPKTKRSSISKRRFNR